MQPPHDYYTILGVTREASAADIRRAFRALAKSLHPDSKPSDRGPQTAYDFSTISEAYETLKDEVKRAAYDEELQNSRQIASQEAAGRKRPVAFAAGLAIGLAIAVGAVFVKGYVDRAGHQKNQESLNPKQKTASLAEPDRPTSRTEADDESATAEEPSASAGAPKADDTEPRENASDETPSAPSSSEKQAALAPEMPSGTTSVERKPAPPMPSQAEAQPDPASSQRPNPLTLTLSEEVLALEHLIDEGSDRNAGRRLTAIVAASAKVEELSRAAAVAAKPETIDLINKRISALLKSQNAPASGGNAAVAAADPAVLAPGLPSRPSSKAGKTDAEAQPVQDGSMQIVVGPRQNEKLLRIKPGNGLAESFSDCPFCPEMVAAPSGKFIMGSKPEEDGHRVEEAPAHRVVIAKAFAVSKHTITNENWRACIQGGGCRAAQFSSFLARPDMPASRLSWFDAKGYVDWLSQETGKKYRLLTEAEWEYAARAGAKRMGHPMTARPDMGRFEPVHFVDMLSARRLKSGSEYAPNAWGLHSMRGSTMEWVEDCWHPSYNLAPADGSAWLSGAGGDCSYRMVRGGFIGTDWARQRLATRAREFADMRAPGLGFRVAREIASP
jgi:formylglycine-generating enzyme required for sulfatase activity/curved DNA-binding protein CbpA